MNIQLSTLFCISIALAIPLLVLSESRQESFIDEDNTDFDRFARSNRHHQQPKRLSYYNDHYHRKKAADFEQILRPCNQMPASGRGHEYADCVRSRMLLMGRRKRRQAN